MDWLAHMRVFRRVVERKSFSKAALDLEQSTAAISKQVRQLEERLGSLLIIRTTRSMSLSETGRAYFAECCRLLDEFDALERTMTVRGGEPTGRLRVNAPLSFGLKVLSPILAQFIARYPKLMVELTLNDSLLDVVTEGFDVSLRIRASLADSALIARRLGDVQQIICAAPGYLKARGMPPHPDSLREHDLLVYRLADDPGSWHLDGPEGIINVELPARFAVDNSLMLSDMLQAGLGIGALPSFIAFPAIERGELVQVLAEYKMAARTIYALYPSSRHLQQKVTAFVDFLSEALKEKHE
jgi:DNA-binding transcriptional LysR family regulator